MGGSMEGPLGFFSADVILWSAGGGKVAAAPNPIYGPERVARFLVGKRPCTNKKKAASSTHW